MATTGRGGARQRLAAERADEMPAHNRQQQNEIYGQPLDMLVGRVSGSLGLSQARIAGLLGMSQPMLSQLVNAQRVKIGNPVAVQRLQELVALADEVATGRIPSAEADGRLADIASHAGGVVTGTTTSIKSVPPAAAVRTIQGLLRAVADAGELLEAAAAIEKKHPEVAEFLRVYGTGRTQAAIAHFESYAHLI
jgi:transcriptional regulator with XRE-family HTH domain